MSSISLLAAVTFIFGIGVLSFVSTLPEIEKSARESGAGGEYKGCIARPHACKPVKAAIIAIILLIMLK
jgi:hypothetical protein